ncbi:MAG: hypothetical protein HC810_06265 [Acaryochloridaceae cyanobacterium RL_2_7]|nr:hypothetical protein [Acaryochloridaceae cyanobacterium RL_2_7]
MTSLEINGLLSMKLRSTILIACAVLAPIVTGLLNPNSQASFANESTDKTEFQGRRGRWKNLSPEEREAKRAEKAEKMKELLGLSDAQADEVKAIREKYQPQREALKEEAMELRESGDRDQMKALRGKMEDLRQEVKAEMKEVLNEDQVEKLEQLKSQRKGRRGERRFNSES